MQTTPHWRLRTPGGIHFRAITRKGFFAYEEAGVTSEFVIASRHLVAFVQEAFPPPIISDGMF